MCQEIRPYQVNRNQTPWSLTTPPLLGNIHTIFTMPCRDLTADSTSISSFLPNLLLHSSPPPKPRHTHPDAHYRGETLPASCQFHQHCAGTECGILAGNPLELGQPSWNVSLLPFYPSAAPLSLVSVSSSYCNLTFDIYCYGIQGAHARNKSASEGCAMYLPVLLFLTSISRPALLQEVRGHNLPIIKTCENLFLPSSHPI